jgi:hypothetical protein
VTTLERDPAPDTPRVAAGGLMDTLVLRFLLVPSLVVLLDCWN